MKKAILLLSAMLITGTVIAQDEVVVAPAENGTGGYQTL